MVDTEAERNNRGEPKSKGKFALVILAFFFPMIGSFAIFLLTGSPFSGFFTFLAIPYWRWMLADKNITKIRNWVGVET